MSAPVSGVGVGLALGTRVHCKRLWDGILPRELEEAEGEVVAWYPRRGVRGVYEVVVDNAQRWMVSAANVEVIS